MSSVKIANQKEKYSSMKSRSNLLCEEKVSTYGTEEVLITWMVLNIAVLFYTILDRPGENNTPCYSFIKGNSYIVMSY